MGGDKRDILTYMRALVYKENAQTNTYENGAATECISATGNYHLDHNPLRHFHTQLLHHV